MAGGLKHREATVGQLRVPAASGDNGTRTPAWQSGSRGEWRAAAGLGLFVGPPTGGVQTPGQDVGLDLPIPLLGQELLKPP